MRNGLTLITLLFFVFYDLHAQEALLSKEDAVSLALENNFGIKVARNQVEIAENNQSIMNSGFLPVIAGAAGATYQRDDSTFEFPGQFSRDAEGNVLLDPTTGAPVQRPSNDLYKAEAQRYNLGLTANYVLFDGLGRLYNYQRLKEQYQLSELQARETIENTMLQLFSIYFEVARLTENQNVLKQALEISNQRIKRAEYAFDYGQNTKLDILNAQVDVTNDSINLLNNQQGLENTKRDLSVLINQDLSRVYEVDTLVNFIPKLQLEDYIEQTDLNNVAVLQTERNLAINAYDIKVNKSGYLPTIDLNGSYGWNLNQNAPGPFFPGVTVNNRRNFGLGATLRWNLFDGGGTNVRVKNAKIAFENQELLKQQILLEVKRDIQNANAIYENRLNIYEIQEQNVLTNQNNFERSKEQFQLGRITSIEFRQAQINLLNAQTNKNLAKYDAKLAELQLLQLTGQLLNVDF